MREELRVLLIDGDDRKRQGLARALAAADGSAVIEEAADMASGLAAIRRSEFDVAVVSQRLPDGDSLEMLRRLEASERFDVPVIVLAARADEATVLAMLRAGAQDCLVCEPADGKALSQAVRRAVERHRVLARSGDSCRTLQSGLDALSAYVAVLDEGGKIVAVNEAWRRFADPGYLFGESWGVGRDYLDAFRVPEDRAKEAAALATMILKVATRESESGRLEYPWPDLAGPRWFLARVSRCGGAGSGRVVVSHEDCTLRRQTENELRSRVEEVAVLNHRLAARKAELATYHDLLTHDVSNFAMAVQAISERLLDRTDGPLTARQEELLRRNQRQGLEVNRLAENARLLAGLRERGLPPPNEPVLLAPTLRSAFRTVLSLHFDRSFSATSECPEDLAVGGVPFLTNILVNLIDNAVRHSPEGADAGLRILVAGEDDTVRIAVRGGSPPDEEVFSHLFERYVRGHGSRGSGLGLALVREIVERAGGNVKARTVQEAGVPLFEVCVSLPRAKQPAETETEVRPVSA